MEQELRQLQSVVVGLAVRIKELQEFVLSQQELIRAHNDELQVTHRTIIQLTEAMQTMKNVMMEHLV